MKLTQQAKEYFLVETVRRNDTKFSWGELLRVLAKICPSHDIWAWSDISYNLLIKGRIHVRYGEAEVHWVNPDTQCGVKNSWTHRSCVLEKGHPSQHSDAWGKWVN